MAHAAGICGPNPREAAGGAWSFPSFPDLPGWMAEPRLDPARTVDRGAVAVIGCPGDFVLMHRCCPS